MELEIYWTEFSEKELEKIFDYYNEEASFQIAKKYPTEYLERH